MKRTFAVLMCTIPLFLTSCFEKQPKCDDPQVTATVLKLAKEKVFTNALRNQLQIHARDIVMEAMGSSVFSEYMERDPGFTQLQTGTMPYKDFATLIAVSGTARDINAALMKSRDSADIQLKNTVVSSKSEDTQKVSCGGDIEVNGNSRSITYTAQITSDNNTAVTVGF